MKRFSLLLLSALAITSANGKSLTPHQAMQRASMQMKRICQHQVSLQQVASSATMPRYKAAPTSGAAQDMPTYYAFDRTDGAGYVLVSGDDEMPALIGYSTTHHWTTDPGKMPPALRAMLEDYDTYVNQLRQGKVQPLSSLMIDGDHTPVVKQMLTTEWDQNYPYNKYAPAATHSEYGEESEYNGHYPIGCVAVSFAQVMNYFGYPERATGGEVTASCCIYENDEETGWETSTIDLSADGHTYDWDNMPAKISIQDAATDPDYEVKSEAVARLLRDVAYAVNMSWGEWGGESFERPGTMATHFGYSVNAIHMHTESLPGYYSGEAWWQLIQEQLDAHRPAVASGGGHSFVFDGYDASHMVHVNWGWGGWFNDWFDATYLNLGTVDPKYDGYIYSEYATIVIGFQPAIEGETLQLSGYDALINVSGLIENDTQIDFPYSMAVDASSCYETYYYASRLDLGIDFDIRMGLYDLQGQLLDTFGESLSVVANADYLNDNYVGGRYIPFKLPADLADGVYQVLPHSRIYCGEETLGWKEAVACYYEYPGYYITIQDGTATFTWDMPELPASVLRIKQPAADHARIYNLWGQPTSVDSGLRINIVNGEKLLLK